MSNFIKRILLAVVVFGATYAIILNTPGVRAFDVTITSWGWAYVILGCVAGAMVKSFLSGFFSEPLKNVAIAQNPVARKYADEIISWTGLALVVTIGTSVLPQFITTTSIVALFVFGLIYGVVFASYDLLADRLFPRDKK